MSKRTRAPIPKWLREFIYERDGHRCRYCHTDEGPFHVDHVRPWSWGGEDTLENLVTACRSCNLTKGATEWIPTAHIQVARRLVALERKRRQQLLERMASDRGHRITWTPRFGRRRIAHGLRWTLATGADWRCTCMGHSRYASIKDFPLAVRRHLEDVIGASSEPVEYDKSGPMMFMEPLRRKPSR
jgi:hypothetical protein